MLSFSTKIYSKHRTMLTLTSNQETWFKVINPINPIWVKNEPEKVWEEKICKGQEVFNLKFDLKSCLKIAAYPLSKDRHYMYMGEFELNQA